MSVEVTSKVPTLENARAAATACGEACENVLDVFVFGSVAAGDADEWSDIDLLAVVSDKVDKNGDRLSDRLPRIAKTASGVACDVVVRTLFQWEHLTANVSASFDASIEPASVRLFHREPPKGLVLSEDLDGLSANNADVAAHHADNAGYRLGRLYTPLRAYFKDELGWDIPERFDPYSPVERLRHDAQEILEISHHVLELSIRSIGASVCGTHLPKTHQLDVLIETLRKTSQQSYETVEAVDRILGPLRLHEGRVRDWHDYIARHFEEPGWVEESTIENAFDHFAAALAVTRIAIAELDKLEAVSERAAEASQDLTGRIAMLEYIAPVNQELARRRQESTLL